MPLKEKKWFGVTRSQEEDLALVDILLSSRALDGKRIIMVMIVSIAILGVYLAFNHVFYPAYPVVTSFAEKNELFVEHYPPFRMFEWPNYSITQEILEGDLYELDTFSRIHPIGYPLLAAPLVSKMGEPGMYDTNAFILWISAVVFFFLMIELVEYPLALMSTLVLAFATPNLFYAASAFPEPASQLLIVLSLYLFVKGLMSNRAWIFYSLCGLITGLTLFVTPWLGSAILIYAALLIYERGRFSPRDFNIIGLITGFFVPFAVFLIVNRVYLGSYTVFLFSTPLCPFDLTTGGLYGEESNIITGIWKLLFDSPHGLVFIMPVVTLVPMGIIVMWRKEMHTVTIIVGALLLYAVLLTAAGACPVTGESVGSRQLVPVMPLLVIPLAFMWQEQAGEKIWLAVALALTVYMCTFGWWTGVERGNGLFIGALHDRNAGSIILARKGLIGRPDFISASELAEKYIDSLKERDMKLWLRCLDRDVMEEIEGFERIVFNELVKNFDEDDADTGNYIQSVDPNKGVVPVLPLFGGPEDMADE